MINYDVTFSFKSGIECGPALARVAVFLTDLQTRALIHDFAITRNDNGPHFVRIRFFDREQFNRPFKEVGALGIHSGPHGFMIENVAEFSVTTVEDSNPFDR